MRSPSIQSKSRNKLNTDNECYTAVHRKNLNSLEVEYALDHSVCVYLM